MKVTIFKRLVISYIIIFSMVVTASIYTIYQLVQIRRATHSVLIFDNRIIDYQKSLTDSLLSQMRYEKKCVLMKDYTLYDQFLQAKAGFDSDLREAIFIAGDSQVGLLLRRAGRFWQEYQSLVTEEVELLQADQPYDVNRFSEEKDRAANGALSRLKQLGEFSKQSTYERIKDLDEAVAKSRSVALAIMAATLTFGVLISIIITRSITKPLARIKKKTQQIAAGDFESTISLTSPPEIGELASAFNTMCERLKQVDKMKSDFFSLMAHELRTPLTSIHEGTNLLLEGVTGEVTIRQRRLLKIIEEEGKRLIHLVNALLDLSKMEAGMMTYNFMLADLIPLIQRSIREIEPLAQAKNIRLEAINSQTLPRLNVDLEKINQVLRNLIGNAIKFSPEGGRVTVATRVTENGAEVSVSDTGPGIPREDLEMIFDKYQQARNANPSSTKGTGLGLAIVKHIVSAHGGMVWAESEMQKGSVFTFTLPV